MGTAASARRPYVGLSSQQRRALLADPRGTKPVGIKFAISELASAGGGCLPWSLSPPPATGASFFHTAGVIEFLTDCLYRNDVVACAQLTR
jgi:hypothetical protein